MSKGIINNILQSNILYDIFDDVDFSCDTNSILDINSAHVCVLFPGNCKDGSVPYDVHKTYVANVDTKRTALKEYKSNNVIHEYSLNYECPNSTRKISYETSIPEIACDIKDEPADLSILNLHDPGARELKKLIDLLSVNRCEEYCYWFRVVCYRVYK